VIGLALQVAVSNLVFSVALAIVAHRVDRSGRYPAIAHLLWVLVLLKVLTPPLIVLPLLPGAPELPTDASGIDLAAGLAGAGPVALVGAMPILMAGWLLGSVTVLAVSLFRVRRFDALLRDTARPASSEVGRLAESVALRMGLRARPEILLTSARLSPLTWWTGGRVRIVLPAGLCGAMAADELRWVLAHELGHVKRRDHLVRWLEWLACVAFWWNPVVWWARRSLRHAEEASCDALVMSRLRGRPQAYARALLVVVEFLVGPATRPPAVATGMDAGEGLERRFARIVAPQPGSPMPPKLVATVMGAALLLMTLGLGSASLPEPAIAVPTASSARTGSTADEGRGVLTQPPDASTAGAATAADSAAYALLSGRVEVAEPRSRTGAHGGPAGRERVGDSGADRLVGSAGPDRLTGGRGGDRLVGGDGPDRVAGGRGPDVIRGGLGGDLLAGGRGADVLRGGPGSDIIRGGNAADTVHAGTGDDIVVTWQDGSADVIDCGPGDDRAIVDATDTAEACEVVTIR
jgi:beta-lactamase regulating signal transducer with metallopeptidase domain